jgi:hypothetical protein
MKYKGLITLILMLSIGTCTVTYHQEISVHVHKKHIKVSKHDTLSKRDTIIIKYIKNK